MGMKHTEEAIALQAIEFWSTVCEIETELAWELSEVRFVMFPAQVQAKILFRPRNSGRFQKTIASSLPRSLLQKLFLSSLSF